MKTTQYVRLERQIAAAAVNDIRDRWMWGLRLPPPSGPRGLMDEHEVAAYLNIPLDTFRKMRARRDCPRITKIGRRLLWDFADVREYVEAKKEPAPKVAGPRLGVVGRAA